MDGMKSFLTARYGYVLSMLILMVIGIVALVRAFDWPHGDDSGNLIAAAVAFGAITLASKNR
ncbi:MAG TPA: hypothetical protein VGK61_00185 [Planctomycetota bacterium]